MALSIGLACPNPPMFCVPGSWGRLASFTQGNAQPAGVARVLPDGKPSHINGLGPFPSAGPAGRIRTLSLGNGLDSRRTPALAGGLSSGFLERHNAWTHHYGGAYCHGIQPQV